MAKAIYNGAVLAESNQTVELEGNTYFPPDSIKSDHFQPSETTTICPWKGTANYYDIQVDGEVLKDAAWVYRNPSEKARDIKNHVAFWRSRGVSLEP